MNIKHKKIIILMILPILAILLAHLLIIYHPQPICIWKRIFHVDCWGCGITRAFYSLCKLDFVSAWNYNPRVYIVTSILLYIWAKEVYKIFK